MGATGAIELLSCILALREHVIVPTLGLIKKDPEIKLDLVCGDAQEKRVRNSNFEFFCFWRIKFNYSFKGGMMFKFLKTISSEFFFTSWVNF
jgi:hypothetical protein